jgi:putative glutamine amidotransferase
MADLAAGRGDASPVVLVTTWRRRGQVWGAWERDMTGVEWSYVAPLLAVGLSPVLVPAGSPGAVTSLLPVSQGLVVIGGEDVHPEVSGDRDAPVGLNADAEGVRSEIAVVRAALERDVPVLAICRGMQLLAVAQGGTLHSDIAASSSQHPAVPEDLGVALAYRHEVTLTDGSLLADVYGTTRRSVNSLHHQAVADPGAGLVVTARSDDGSVEAVEPADGGGWCAAMQWHPELLLADPAGEDSYEKALFGAFAQRCSR